MRSRSDQPLPNFNFAVDSVFINERGENSGIVQNDFLLLDSELFNLLDGTQLLLLGS